MSRILFADVSPESHAAGQELVRNGHTVIQTTDGLAALRLARQEQPDLIVLDIALPNLDGLTLCRILRR